MSNLKQELFDFVCDKNDQCSYRDVAKDLINVNEDLKRQLSILKSQKTTDTRTRKSIETNSKTTIIYSSDTANDVIYIQPIYKGITISEVELYGFFGINENTPNGDKQSVFTRFKYDEDDILYCFIDDFRCFGSCGYGTTMMSVLKEYLQNFPVAYILGEISVFDSQDSNDPEHNSRLHHFYEKNGFEFINKGKTEFVICQLKDKEECSKEYIQVKSRLTRL